MRCCVTSCRSLSRCGTLMDARSTFIRSPSPRTAAVTSNSRTAGRPGTTGHPPPVRSTDARSAATAWTPRCGLTWATSPTRTTTPTCQLSPAASAVCSPRRTASHSTLVPERPARARSAARVASRARCGSSRRARRLGPGDAEGVAGRVHEDPPPAAARLEPWLRRTQFHQCRLGAVQVVDDEVEVELLRNALVGPRRRPVVVDSLEADEEPVFAGESGEVVAGGVGALEPGRRLVEAGERCGILAVECDRYQPHRGAHADTISAQPVSWSWSRCPRLRPAATHATGQADRCGCGRVSPYRSVC